MSEPTPWPDIVNAIAAGASAVAAGAALFAAKRANTAAERANDTADAVARIERDRWHTELTPQFEITATRLGPGTNRVALLMTLTGPAGLPQLDAVTITIRDDGYTHLPGVGVTQEMLDATIFGPYQFEPGIDDADPDGRRVTTNPMQIGDWVKHSLSVTPVPAWSNLEYWREQYRNEPIRLRLECKAAGFKPWYIATEVRVAEPTAG
ncbi:hypothetical protein [Streptomyces sp. NPDC049590]|uniref:hypothetical protein n=1 Tax=Streptomyces sp. NPDC049590 TaxID=3154834 RepID=UPI00341E3957